MKPMQKFDNSWVQGSYGRGGCSVPVVAAAVTGHCPAVKAYPAREADAVTVLHRGCTQNSGKWDTVSSGCCEQHGSLPGGSVEY